MLFIRSDRTFHQSEGIQKRDRTTDQTFRGESLVLWRRSGKSCRPKGWKRSTPFNIAAHKSSPREKATEADIVVRCPTGRIQVAVLYVFQSGARTARELHESPNTLNCGWRKIVCRDCTPRCCRVPARNLWRFGTCIVDTSFEYVSKIRYCWIYTVSLPLSIALTLLTLCKLSFQNLRFDSRIIYTLNKYQFFHKKDSKFNIVKYINI